MKITVTGATGLIGRRLVAELKRRGDDVTVLSRNAAAAEASLGVKAYAWKAETEEAPVEALTGRDAVIHLAGEPVAQRWSAKSKEAIRASRVDGTSNLVAGLRQAQSRPSVLVSGSAVGWYGPLGDQPVDESAPAGTDFLAQVCADWEKAAEQAQEIGIRTAIIRTGVVLAADDGALAKMLPPFKAGVGGPVAGGAQMMPWIHLDDIVGLIIAAVDGGVEWSGPINGTAPIPVSNKVFSKALGKALKRPSFSPVPAFAIKAMYGEMSQIVLTGQNAVPAKATELGFKWSHDDLDEALTSVLAK
jgi:uncharacterized protein (TIGR01777 family)